MLYESSYPSSIGRDVLMHSTLLTRKNSNDGLGCVSNITRKNENGLGYTLTNTIELSELRSLGNLNGLGCSLIHHSIDRQRGGSIDGSLLDLSRIGLIYQAVRILTR